MKKRNRKTTGRFIVQKQLPKKRPFLDEIAKGQRDYDVVNVDKDASKGEYSPYWQWAENHSKHTEDGEIQEMPMANPDYLGGGDTYTVDRGYLQEQIEKTWQMLSPMEKQVFQLLSQGATEVQVANVLKIKRGTVKGYRKQIYKKYVTATPKEA